MDRGRRKPVFVCAALIVLGCSKREPESTGIAPRDVADAIHAVIEADRTAYAQKVVTRMQNEHNIVKATEHWEDEKTLPLPAQMLRMGAETVQKKGARFSYALLSPWAVNKKNSPATDAERQGLAAVSKNAKQNFYAEETLGERKFFTAVYADVAVAEACVACHNQHKDSPRKDFKLGDVMGGLVVRIPLDGKMM
jgi:Iap family predicted aminopeptidase